jgi:hypothetical protein
MGLQDLLEHDLGHGRSDDLDLNPPAVFLDTLARRSGLDTDRLRGMTLAGMTPWVLDSVEADPGPEAFDCYVGQFSVLLPSSRRPRREVPGWRAWAPPQPILRACQRCLEASGHRVLLLLWQLPLSVGCPVHGCRLEPFLGTPGDFLAWASEHADPRPVPEACAAMDRRTWQALTQGYVDLPRRRVHAGVWFRLLRSCVEDLLTARSRYPDRGRNLCSVWERSGHPLRAGLWAWQPYEALGLPVQERVLEAAAVAIRMVETGAIAAPGAAAAFLLAEPPVPVIEGRLGSVSPWRRVSEAATEAIEAARRDPRAAQELLRAILLGRTDEELVRRVRKLLLDVGVPSEMLSQ